METRKVGEGNRATVFVKEDKEFLEFVDAISMDRILEC